MIRKRLLLFTIFLPTLGAASHDSKHLKTEPNLSTHPNVSLYKPAPLSLPAADKSSKVNFEQNTLKSYLLESIRIGSYDSLQALLNIGPIDHGLTLIQAALDENKVILALLIINHKNIILHPTQNAFTKLLFLTLEKGHAYLVKALLNRVKKGYNAILLFKKALVQGKQNVACTIIEHPHVTLDAQPFEFDFFLLFALKRDYDQIVPKLLSLKAYDLSLLIQKAIDYGSNKAIAAIIKHGKAAIDPNMIISYQGDSISLENYALKQKQINIIMELNTIKGIYIPAAYYNEKDNIQIHESAQSSGSTALMMAASQGHMSVIQTLLNLGPTHMN